ncbi:MAG: PorV/PorQ family protein [candidate division Zixibacteria bacterium]|nr:PorV/PorQ family protein [candidate division Zixibacteria bacterium]
MMKKIIAIFMILTLAGTSGALAEDGNAGGPAAFLKLGFSARVMGMGGTYLAVSDDATGMFYNPAGLAQLKWNSASASYRHMDFDRKFGYVAFGVQALEEATVAGGWIHASDGNFVGRDNEGTPTGDDLSYSDNTIALSFAKKFGDIFMVGATGKYFISSIAGITSNTVTFDVGGMAVLDKLNFFEPDAFLDVVRVGLVAENLGGTHRFNTGDFWAERGEIGVAQDEDMLLGFKGGVSALALDSTTLVSVDFRKIEDHDIKIYAGGEYVFNKLVALRAGYADERLAFGGGISKTFIYYRFKLDYAFVTAIDGEAPDHLFTIGFEFR